MRLNRRLVVGLLLSAVAFGLILRRVHVVHMATILARADYGWVVPSVACTLAAMGVRACRWRALLHDRVSVGRAFHVGNVGNLLNNVLPMRLGEVARAYLLGRHGEVSVMQALSTIAVERLLDVLTVFGLLLVVLPFVPADEMFLRAGGAVAAVAFGGVLALVIGASFREQLGSLAQRALAWIPARFRAPLLDQVDDFLRGIQSIGAKQVVVSVLWSLLAWVGWVGGCWMLLFAFAPNATWYMGVFVTCAIALGLTIPSAPAGAGIYEAAVVAALALFGIPGDVALAFGLTLHLTNFMVVALVGTWGLNAEGQTLAGVASSAQSLHTSE